jgi:hypothetical protein
MLRPAISSSSFSSERFVKDLVSRRGFVVEPMEARQLLTITAAFVPVTISAAAITADSQLSNYKTFDLQVTVGSGDEVWRVEVARILPQGDEDAAIAVYRRGYDRAA